MAKLYELIKEIEDFVPEIDEETGEILNCAELDLLEVEKEQKVENICLWIKNLLSDSAAYKAEKESFQKKEQAAKNKAESLKKYLTYALGGEGFKTDRVTVSYRKSESVNIEDVTRLDDEFIRVPEPVPDKTAIKQAIKAGREVVGAELVERKNIQIK